MRLLLGFLFGVIVAVAGQAVAQNMGGWMDNQGNRGTYYQAPGGGISSTDQYGNTTYINPMPLFPQAPQLPFTRKNPC